MGAVLSDPLEPLLISSGSEWVLAQVRIPLDPPESAQLFPSLPVVKPLLIFPTGDQTRVEVTDPSRIYLTLLLIPLVQG